MFGSTTPQREKSMSLDASPIAAETLTSVMPDSLPMIPITNPRAFLGAVGVGIAFFTAIKLLQHFEYITLDRNPIRFNRDDNDDTCSLPNRDVIQINTPNQVEQQQTEEAAPGQTTLPAETPEKVEEVAEQVLSTPTETEESNNSFYMTIEQGDELHLLID